MLATYIDNVAERLRRQTRNLLLSGATALVETPRAVYFKSSHWSTSTDSAPFKVAPEEFEDFDRVERPIRAHGEIKQLRWLHAWQTEEAGDGVTIVRSDDGRRRVAPWDANFYAPTLPRGRDRDRDRQTVTRKGFYLTDPDNIADSTMLPPFFRCVERKMSHSDRLYQSLLVASLNPNHAAENSNALISESHRFPSQTSSFILVKIDRGTPYFGPTVFPPIASRR
ncbi:hypothetical protein DFJ73DRAFT_966149 [Zopfochytrium polystomum]|nr:hypothetical protein DFJ73DRAFT_966149 [Zopfochytrium polystomum]